MASDSSVPRLDDRTFRLCVFALHRAFLQLPPTLIPDLEPMHHPCHEDLHQPAGFQPDNIHHLDHPGIDIPTDTDEEGGAL